MFKMMVCHDDHCCDRIGRGEGFGSWILEKTDVEVLGPSVVVMHSMSPHIPQGHTPTTRGRRSSTSVFFFAFLLHRRLSRCQESLPEHLCNVLNSLHVTVAPHSKARQFKILHMRSDGVPPFVRSFSRSNFPASSARSVKSPSLIAVQSHPTSTSPRFEDHQPWTCLQLASKTNLS